jgi:predicted CoA-binding protein
MPENAIGQFLAGDVFAVAGASPNRNKYGKKVLRATMRAGRKVFPIHPAADHSVGSSMRGQAHRQHA